MEEALPRPFGRYRLTGILGHGGMASVYRAESEPVAGVVRTVAIKRMLQRAGGGEGETDFQALVDEARIWVRLHHPNIVGVVDFGEAGGDLFLALELVDGLSASALVLQSSPLSPAEALLVIERVARALAHAHSLRDEAGKPLKVVHRDVKPSNILVSRDGDVKLTDFGIARATIRDSQTEAGFVKGSLGFLSPEQVRGEELDGRSDLFSLGCTLYALVTGRVPVPPGKSRMVVMEKIANGETLPPPDFLAPRLRELLGSLMAPRLAERPATAEEVVKRVRTLLEEDADDLQRALGERVVRAIETPSPAKVVVTGDAVTNGGGAAAPITQTVAPKTPAPFAPPLVPPPPAPRTLPAAAPLPAPPSSTETALVAPPPFPRAVAAPDPAATDILVRVPAPPVVETGSTPGPAAEPLFPHARTDTPDPAEYSGVGPAAGGAAAEPLFPAVKKRQDLRREVIIFGTISVAVISLAAILGNSVGGFGFGSPKPYGAVATPRASSTLVSAVPTVSPAATVDASATAVPVATRVAVVAETRASQALTSARSFAASGKYERAIEILYLEALRDHPPGVSEDLHYHVCLYSSKLHGLSSGQQIRARYDRYLQRFPNSPRAVTVREWQRSLAP